MTIAFVVVKAEPGRENDVYHELQKVGEIAELHPLFGEYDLIAKIEAASFDALGEVIVSKMRTIPGVQSTKTFAGTTW